MIKYFSGGYTQTIGDVTETWVWKDNKLCLKERKINYVKHTTIPTRL